MTRQETPNHHRKYWALAGLVAFVAVVILALLDSGAASPGVAARMSVAGQAGTPRIAFLSDVPNARLRKGVRWQGELYVMNIDGSDMRRLARFASGFQPTWSPDGRMMAFDRRVGPRRAPPPGNGACRVCHGEIFVVNADGSGKRNLTGHLGGGNPAWSPDGQTIAFSRDDGFIPNLYVMSADGNGQRRVTPDGFHAWGSAWSPDGRRIAFGSVVGGVGNNRNGDIFVVNVDGSGLQNLTRNRAMDDAPAWSPDGQTIAFLTYREGLRAKALYLMNADGSEQRRLVRLSNSDGSFSWSPDGRRIAFVSDRDGNDDVYVVNVDGSGLRNLTRSPMRDGHPVWSSDGRTIGFVSNRGGNRDIFVINTDGSGLQNLTGNLDQKAFGISWSPAQR